MNWFSRLWKSIQSKFSSAPPAQVAAPCGTRAQCEATLRAEVVEGMRLANRRPGGIEYGSHLDPKYWKKLGPYQWVLQPDVKPSEAVERIFELGAESRVECLSVMSAVHYRAILKTVGPDKFDQLFADDVRIGGRPNPLLAKGLIKKKAGLRADAAEVNVADGDWVYVRGHPDYDSPEMAAVLGPNWGAWRGENAIVQDGGAKLSGLGLQDEAQDEMEAGLLGGYNEKVDEYNRLRPPDTPEKPHGTPEEMPGLNPTAVYEVNADAIFAAAH